MISKPDLFLPTLYLQATILFRGIPPDKFEFCTVEYGLRNEVQTEYEFFGFKGDYTKKHKFGMVIVDKDKISIYGCGSLTAFKTLENVIKNYYQDKKVELMFTTEYPCLWM